MSNRFPIVAGARFALFSLIVAGASGSALAAGAKTDPSQPELQIQFADSAVLAPREPAPIATQVAQTPQPAGLAPAPIPNLDANGPLGAAPQAKFMPALLSRNTEFEGDGFSHGSNRDYGEDQREAPAAGVNLSVPVK